MKITITLSVKNKLDEQRTRQFLRLMSDEQERTGEAIWRILRRFMIAQNLESEKLEQSLRDKLRREK